MKHPAFGVKKGLVFHCFDGRVNFHESLIEVAAGESSHVGDLIVLCRGALVLWRQVLDEDSGSLLELFAVRKERGD